MVDAAIKATGLVVRFGSHVALGGIDLEVEPGRVVGLLGPNGAGKSTCVETLLGYRRPDAGSVRVLGLDPVSDHRSLVPRVGAMLQRGGVWPSMSAVQALMLFASYYEDPEDPVALASLLSLEECGRTPWRRLSGGEQQRLSLAIALLAKPAALFLDEPTAGVDPIGRRVIRDVIDRSRQRGVAVLVCTHDLADVEAVCDTAVILHHGTVRASGAVADLTGGGTTFTTVPGLDLVTLAAVVGDAVHEPAPGTYRSGVVLDGQKTAALATHLGSLGHSIDSLRQGSSLEDRYVELVGTDADTTHDDVPAVRRAARRRR